MRFFWIGLLGLFGVFARFFIDELMTPISTSVPWGIFLINVLGSFLAGFLYVVGIERMHLPPDLRIGIMVGLLGGFTTFSSYALQSARMLETGHLGPGLFYFLMSPAMGLSAVFGGLALGRAVFPG